MNKFLIITLCTLSFSGCIFGKGAELIEEGKESYNNIVDEANQVKENIEEGVDKAIETKNDIETAIDKVNDAKEAIDAITE